jgi:hypothetical protein
LRPRTWALRCSNDQRERAERWTSARKYPRAWWSLQVRVYAGLDPVTGRDRYLTESVRGQGAGALPAVAGRGGTAVGGGVRDGRGLGHARVARHDDWHPPRRGLRSALRDIDRDGETIEIRRNYVLHRGVGVEKDTKTHQMRRIALDSETVALLREQKARVAARAADLGSEFAGELYMFGGLKSPDHRTPYSPRAVSSRYRDMAERLGIRTHITHFATTRRRNCSLLASI